MKTSLIILGVNVLWLVILFIMSSYRGKEQARQKEEEARKKEEEKRIKERELNYSNAKKEVLNFIDNYN